MSDSSNTLTEAELALLDYQLRRIMEEYNLAIASGTPTPTRGATAPAVPTDAIQYDTYKWDYEEIETETGETEELQCDSHDWRVWPLDVNRQYCRVCGIDEGVED